MDFQTGTTGLCGLQYLDYSEKKNKRSQFQDYTWCNTSCGFKFQMSLLSEFFFRRKNTMSFQLSLQVVPYASKTGFVFLSAQFCFCQNTKRAIRMTSFWCCCHQTTFNNQTLIHRVILLVPASQHLVLLSVLKILTGILLSLVLCYNG